MGGANVTQCGAVRFGESPLLFAVLTPAMRSWASSDEALDVPSNGATSFGGCGSDNLQLLARTKLGQSP